MTRWLVSRQTLTLQDDEDGLDVVDDEPPDPEPAPAPPVFPPTFHVLGGFSASMDAATHTNPPSVEVSEYDRQWVGVNGRCNKVADTCYTFWVGGTLGVSSCRNPESVDVF